MRDETVNDDLILFGRPYRLMDEEAWIAHQEQLDEDYGLGCHHGEPEAFPCLVISRSSATRAGAMHYSHDFVSVDDALTLIEAVQSEHQEGEPASLDANRTRLRRIWALWPHAVEFAAREKGEASSA